MKVILPLPPVGVNHAYHTRGGKWYKDNKISSWETECLWEMKRVTVLPSAQHCYRVKISFYDKDKRRRDIDGRIKPVLDMLQKAACYPDDSLVTDLIVAKRIDPNNPRMEVEVI